ncbi:hypothetical protein STEG23_024341 [Scotinomys teguina]
MTVTPLGQDQDCSLKIQQPDVLAPWFLDPGGWSKTAAVSLYFIFPGICTLSLAEEMRVKLGPQERFNLDTSLDLSPLNGAIHIQDALLTDKVKVKEQLVEAEQSLEKIQEEEVRKSVSAPDTQSEDEEESQFEAKAQKVKEFSLAPVQRVNRRKRKDAERPMWFPEHCMRPVDVPADTKDHEDDPDSTNIGTGAMDVGKESSSTNSSRHS